jgi:hypothetical protein
LPKKQRLVSHPAGSAARIKRPLQKSSIWSGNEKKRYNQGEENSAQNDRDPEQRALNAASSSKDTACIGAGQSSQACTFAL